MRFGSLFSGIGGIDLGLERAGMECAWQVENDDYCQRVLAKHWPNVPRYGDIKEVDFARLEPVELLAGGFPCQDLSYAGKGLGLSGARSGLWSEFKRAVRVVRPRYVLVENVPGLLGRGMGAVLGDLASLGYDVEWESIPAAAVGAPHLRWRVFVVAYAECGGRVGTLSYLREHYAPRRLEWLKAEDHGLSGEAGGEPGVLADAERPEWWQGQPGRDEPNRTTSKWEETAGGPRALRPHDGTRAMGDTERASSYAFAAASPPRSAVGERGWWSVEPDVGRVAHGVPRRVDRLRGLGNAVVPQKAEWLGRLILDHAGRAV